MSKLLRETVSKENKYWSKIFESELSKNEKKEYSSFWWEDYYADITKYVNSLIVDNKFTKILEAGCGSGKATILLDKKTKKTLLDISKMALRYAKHLANKFKADNVKYVQGNVFSMPFDDKAFNLVWNIGLVEHYDISDVHQILREMVRVCSKSGIVAVGIPNFFSGPILKAWILKILKIFPGYKLDTEKFYNPKEIKILLKQIAYKSRRKIKYVKVEYFGSPLLMETPASIISMFKNFSSTTFKNNNFLILIVCKFE